MVLANKPEILKLEVMIREKPDKYINKPTRIATNVVDLLTKYLSDEIGIGTIQAFVMPDNIVGFSLLSIEEFLSTEKWIYAQQ